MIVDDDTIQLVTLERVNGRLLASAVRIIKISSE